MRFLSRNPSRATTTMPSNDGFPSKYRNPSVKVSKDPTIEIPKPSSVHGLRSWLSPFERSPHDPLQNKFRDTSKAHLADKNKANKLTNVAPTVQGTGVQLRIQQLESRHRQLPINPSSSSASLPASVKSGLPSNASSAVSAARSPSSFSLSSTKLSERSIPTQVPIEPASSLKVELPLNNLVMETSDAIVTATRSVEQSQVSGNPVTVFRTFDDGDLGPPSIQRATANTHVLQGRGKQLDSSMTPTGEWDCVRIVSIRGLTSRDATALPMRDPPKKESGVLLGARPRMSSLTCLSDDATVLSDPWMSVRRQKEKTLSSKDDTHGCRGWHPNATRRNPLVLRGTSFEAANDSDQDSSGTGRFTDPGILARPEANKLPFGKSIWRFRQHGAGTWRARHGIARATPINATSSRGNGPVSTVGSTSHKVQTSLPLLLCNAPAKTVDDPGRLVIGDGCIPPRINDKEMEQHQESSVRCSLDLALASSQAVVRSYHNGLSPSMSFPDFLPPDLTSLGFGDLRRPISSNERMQMETQNENTHREYGHKRSIVNVDSFDLESKQVVSSHGKQSEPAISNGVRRIIPYRDSSEMAHLRLASSQEASRQPPSLLPAMEPIYHRVPSSRFRNGRDSDASSYSEASSISSSTKASFWSEARRANVRGRTGATSPTVTNRVDSQLDQIFDQEASRLGWIRSHDNAHPWHPDVEKVSSERSTGASSTRVNIAATAIESTIRSKQAAGASYGKKSTTSHDPCKYFEKIPLSSESVASPMASSVASHGGGPDTRSVVPDQPTEAKHLVRSTVQISRSLERLSSASVTSTSSSLPSASSSICKTNGEARFPPCHGLAKSIHGGDSHSTAISRSTIKRSFPLAAVPSSPVRRAGFLSTKIKSVPIPATTTWKQISSQGPAGISNAPRAARLDEKKNVPSGIRSGLSRSNLILHATVHKGDSGSINSAHQKPVASSFSSSSVSSRLSIHQRLQVLQDQWDRDRVPTHVKKIQWQPCKTTGRYKKKVVLDYQTTS